MPIALDPNETLQYTLVSERGKPSAAAFKIRYLTCREFSRAAKLYDQALAENDLDKTIDLLQQVIAAGVVTMPENVQADGLTMDELWELARAVCEEPRLKEREKKAFASQSQSAPAASAAGAPGSPASAG